MQIPTLLEVLDVPGSQGDPDLVDLGTSGSTGLLVILLGGHFVCSDSDLLRLWERRQR
jgi:hypothetical protein